jgi:tRNA-specific 2-thiouridylase
MSKVLVALSGGIDSSYTAYLLKKEGYEVVGVYMKLHENDEYHKKNLENIEKVANFLDIKYYVLDKMKEFKKRVYDPFVEGYIKGLTPNPCAVCNRYMKFGALDSFKEEIGAKYLATGHYVRHDGSFLYEAKDKSKDQSYFLFNIEKKVLKNIIFPLGDRLKADVKDEALRIELFKSIASQKESSEICFVDTNYVDILKLHTDVDMRGEVVNSKGEVIGEHKGYMHYTIGKRKGFRVFRAHKPHYVLDIIPHKNQIVVGLKEELEKKEVVLDSLNMFIDKKEFEAEIKIRYRMPKVKCSVKIDKNRARVKLKEPVFGLAKGQAGVFYMGDRLIGGGWIV